MIQTVRLDLVPATPALIRAELDGPDALAAALDAAVSAEWPPAFFDEPALRYTLDALERGPEHAGWWTYYVIVREGRRVVGVVGYKGPPQDGGVEVGYSVATEAQRRGIATEATRALIDRAFTLPEVDFVQAETLPELVPSIGVLEKLGFDFVGEGSEAGVIRYRLARPV